MSIPHDDPKQHAVEFSHRWVDRLEWAVEGRMHALDIEEEMIGMSDLKNGVVWRTFFPDEVSGGGVTGGGRINVDSGVLNSDLFKGAYDEQASRLWACSRIRDRIDAIIMHEYYEYFEKTHAGSLEKAWKTDRPISKKTRNLLMAMYLGWFGGRNHAT